jgi:hypothetical protein
VPWCRWVSVLNLSKSDFQNFRNRQRKLGRGPPPREAGGHRRCVPPSCGTWTALSPINMHQGWHLSVVPTVVYPCLPAPTSSPVGGPAAPVPHTWQHSPRSSNSSSNSAAAPGRVQCRHQAAHSCGGEQGLEEHPAGSPGPCQTPKGVCSGRHSMRRQGGCAAEGHQGDRLVCIHAGITAAGPGGGAAAAAAAQQRQRAAGVAPGEVGAGTA